MKQHDIGLLSAFGSSAFLSTHNIISRYLFQFLNQPTLMSLWFLFAAPFSVLVGIYSDKKQLVANLRNHWKAGLIIAATNIAAAVAFFTSIKILGPSPTAFFSKLDIIFIVILGSIFLKEKLNAKEILGISIAAAGGFVFAFSSEHLSANSYLGLIMALAIAVNTLFARIYTQNASVAVLQIYRIALTAFFITGFAVLTGSFALPEAKFILLAATGALLSAVIGVGLYYSALKRIKASIAALIRNLDPFLVALYAYPIFHTFPSLREWTGGIIIITGVTITLLAMNSHNKLYKKAKASVSHG